MHMSHLMVAGVLAFMLVFTGGCPPKVSTRSHARYELGHPFKFRPAEPGGEYRVKWSETIEGPWVEIAGSERTVAEGDLLGFTMENGMLTAVAAESRFVISPVPPEAKYFIWMTEFVKGADGKPVTKPAETP